LIKDWNFVILSTAVRASTSYNRKDLSGGVHLLIGDESGKSCSVSRQSETGDSESILRSISQSEGLGLCAHSGGKRDLIGTAGWCTETVQARGIWAGGIGTGGGDQVVRCLVTVHGEGEVSGREEGLSTSGNGESEDELERTNGGVGSDWEVVMSQISEFELLLDVEGSSAVVDWIETHTGHTTGTSRRTPSHLNLGWESRIEGSGTEVVPVAHGTPLVSIKLSAGCVTVIVEEIYSAVRTGAVKAAIIKVREGWIGWPGVLKHGSNRKVKIGCFQLNHKERHQQ